MQSLLQWISNKYYIFWVSVCSLSFPARKAHSHYYIVICGLSGSTIFNHIMSSTVRFSISITYSEWVSVVLVFQHAKRMRSIILSTVTCPDQPYLTTLCHQRYDFRETRVTERKICVLILCIKQPPTFWEYLSGTVIKAHRYSCKAFVILLRCN